MGDAAMGFLGEPLATIWNRLGSWPYDLIYRRGAPWEGVPRAELVDLLGSGRLTPGAAGGARALDVGCGSGADSILLSDHGFDVVGVDFSAVAVAKARASAGDRGVRFIEADLFDLPAEATGRPFDLIFDGGTLDDFPASQRRALARILTGLANPGAVMVLWCFSADAPDLPLFSVSGPSRFGGAGIPESEVRSVFGPAWEIERLRGPSREDPSACYWMERRRDGQP